MTKRKTPEPQPVPAGAPPETPEASPIFIPPTREWAVADLIDADYNPREITDQQLADLQASIEDFGLVEDVVVNVHPARRGIVVGGHQKLKILRAKGMLSVPCKEVSLSPERERELNVRLNANGGRFSSTLLAEAFSREDLESWGLSAEDLEGFEKAAADMERSHGASAGGPEAFPVISPDKETQHTCPKCAYQWNGDG